MGFSGLFLTWFLLAGVAGVACCVFLVLMVVFFSTGKKSAGVSCAVAMALSIICAASLMVVGIRGLRANLREHIDTAWQDVQHQSERIEKLKSHVDPKVLKAVDEEFFTFSGFRDWWRIPLVYPYSVHCIDSMDSPGSLRTHDGQTPIADDNGEASVLDGVTHYSFDGKLLLMRCRTANRTTYVLFTFADGGSSTFDTRDELLSQAKARGYTGDTKMLSIEDRFDEYFD